MGGSERAAPAGRTIRDITIICIVVLALGVPFLDQAFHWDDGDFIKAAEVAAVDPSRFHLENYSARGRFKERFPFRHPPLLNYYMAPFIRAAGGADEMVLHSAYLVFPLGAAISMYALGRRFTRHPLAAALLLAVSPGVMVMSHTVMGNVPGMAFWLAATALFVWGVERYSLKLLLGAGLAMAAAIMTFAQALTLLPLLAVYALLKRQVRWKVITAFIIPVLVYGSWRYYIRQRYGYPPAISYRVDFHLGWQLRALLVFLGGTIVFPLSLLVPLAPKKRWQWLVLAAASLTGAWAAWVYITGEGVSPAWGVVAGIMAAAGLAAVCGLVTGASSDIRSLVSRTLPTSTDNIFLLAWFGSVAVAYIASTLHYVAARHLLPLFPAVVFVFLRQAEGLWQDRPWLRSRFIYGTIALTAVVSLAASVADYRLAGTYRNAAQHFGQEYSESGRKLWALGEFGFRYYMEEQGFEYLGVNAVARPGDIVVVSDISSRGVVAPLPEGAGRLLYQLRQDDGFPVRTMNYRAGAGFYGSLMGPLPFVMSRERVDDFMIYELDWQESG